MRTSWGLLLVATLLGAGLGCSADAPSSSENTLSSPAGPGSGQPRLYADAEGAVWLSWVAPIDGDRHALRYATLRDTGWTAPATVATGADWFVNWADLPSVRPLPDGRIAAHYLESNGQRGLAYAVRLAQSTGRGTWHPPVTPHDDGTPTEHGFVSMLPWPDDRLLAVWLDGREMREDGEMTLRGAVLDSTGTVERRDRIDGRTCECCATSAVRIGGEALVAYRDRSADEVRNIRLVRFDGTDWTEPTLLHDDGWQIEGCPVNGPALAARGERVVAAWFTAADGVPRVRAAFSDDGGRHFADPVVVAEGSTQGRVDAVLRDDGSAVVSWLGERDDRGAVRMRAVAVDSAMTPVTTIADLPSTARRVGFPKLVRKGHRLYAAWVGPDSTGASGVQMARLPLPVGP